MQEWYMENIAFTDGGPMYCLISALLIERKKWRQNKINNNNNNNNNTKITNKFIISIVDD